MHADTMHTNAMHKHTQKHLPRAIQVEIHRNLLSVPVGQKYGLSTCNRLRDDRCFFSASLVSVSTAAISSASACPISSRSFLTASLAPTYLSIRYTYVYMYVCMYYGNMVRSYSLIVPLYRAHRVYNYPFGYS